MYDAEPLQTALVAFVVVEDVSGAQTKLGTHGKSAKLADELPGLGVGDEAEFPRGWHAQLHDDDGQLIHVVLAGEVRLPSQELSQDAPHCPHINCRRVVVTGEQQLWRPIPSRDHILSHQVLLRAAEQI